MFDNLELDIIARPIAEKIAEIYTPGSPPYHKINPKNVSKLLPGWYVTAYDEDGNEIEISIQTYRRAMTSQRRPRRDEKIGIGEKEV